MAGEKLTKRVVDALKAPEPSEVGVKLRESFVWDRELRGFGVQVMPSGLKSFVIQSRTAEGRHRRVVIGRYGPMTVEEARTLAHEQLVAVSKGVDPVAEAAKAAGLQTVAEICDWYIAEAEAGRILGRRRRAIKASTLVMDRSRIEAHIKPLLGKRQVASLKLGDIEALDERDALLAFAKDLDARLEAAASARVAAAAALADADTQSVIAPPGEQAAWLRQADEATVKLTTLEREHARVTGARAHLPGKLKETDEKITAAYEDLMKLKAEHAKAETAALMQKIGNAVEHHLAPLLLQLHALRAAGIDIRFSYFSYRNDLLGKSVGVGDPLPFIHGNEMTLGEETIKLNEKWRNNPVALELFEKHRPLNAKKYRLEPEIRRIQAAAEAARIAADKAARDAPKGPWIQRNYAKQAEPNVPPKSAEASRAAGQVPPEMPQSAA